MGPVGGERDSLGLAAPRVDDSAMQSRPFYFAKALGSWPAHPYEYLCFQQIKIRGVAVSRQKRRSIFLRLRFARRQNDKN